MMKFSWLKWFLYFVIALLSLEVLKTVITKLQFSANYFVAIILMSLQTLVILGFLYYAIFVIIFKRRLARGKLHWLFAISFVCLIVLFEFASTYWLHHPDKIPAGLKWAYKYYYDTYNFRIIQYEKDIISPDDELRYILKPGARTNFRNAEFSTSISINKKGFRDSDSSVVSPEIICLGDSYTMGWGVEESQSFPKILEKKIGKKVLNAGIPSYGTARELLLLNRLDVSALKYIIIQYCSNDLDENLSFISNNYKLELTPLDIYKSALRTYELSRKYFPGKNFLLIGQLWMKDWLNRLYPIFKFSGDPYLGKFDSLKHASSFLNILSKFRQKLKDVKIIVTNIDIYKYHKGEFIDELSFLAKRMLTIDEMKNIVFINTTNFLTDKDYFILDYHIRNSGHEKIANKLLEALKEQ